MEYAAGGELFDRIIMAGRFSENEARYFFQQLISGVSYCHFRQVCHRDLKLANTLLDGSPVPILKICDFGFSKSSMLHSRPKSIAGTLRYIAPEVLSGSEYNGKLADVWSCGVTLYIMLVGAYPFEDQKEPRNYRKTVQRILGAQYKIPDVVYISQDYRNLLSRILVALASRSGPDVYPNSTHEQVMDAAAFIANRTDVPGLKHNMSSASAAFKHNLTGSFPVKWHIIKDIPNPNFRHIILENNENKPVTNSRDTQEIKYKKGMEMLKIFKNYTSKTSLLDDFMYYEKRQKLQQQEKARKLVNSYENPFILPPRKLNGVLNLPIFIVFLRKRSINFKSTFVSAT